MQLIETSSITGHFAEERKEVYLNIFSCKWFDGEKAVTFCREFFKATKFVWQEFERDVEYFYGVPEDVGE